MIQEAQGKISQIYVWEIKIPENLLGRKNLLDQILVFIATEYFMLILTTPVHSSTAEDTVPDNFVHKTLMTVKRQIFSQFEASSIIIHLQE